MEHQSNKQLREAIHERIKEIQEERNITKGQIAKLVTNKLPEGQNLPAPYLSDLLSGRRNLLTTRCVALLDALGLELEIKIKRRRAKRLKGKFFEFDD